MRVSFLFRTLFSFILILIVVLCSLSYASNKLKSTYIQIAQLQSKNVVSKMINQIVIDNLKDYHLTPYRDENGLFSYDIETINRIVFESNKKICYALENINHNDYSFILENSRLSDYALNGIIYEIPFSIISRNVLFSSFGPNVPVRFNLLGEVLSNVDYKVESFGVNNALITIMMVVNFSFEVYLPLASSNQDLSLKIPLIMNVIEGDVPNLIGTYQMGK